MAAPSLIRDINSYVNKFGTEVYNVHSSDGTVLEFDSREALFGWIDASDPLANTRAEARTAAADKGIRNPRAQTP